MVPGRGPVKIAAAMAIAAATFGGGLAYKKFKTYLHEKQLRKARRQRDASASEQEQIVSAVRKGAASKSRKQPRKRKRAATKSKRKPGSARNGEATRHLAATVSGTSSRDDRYTRCRHRRAARFR
jgi:hypothetical protein